MEFAEVKQQIQEKLSSQAEINGSDNLLELGLSSLVMMRLVNQWRKQGVKVSFGKLMEEPTLDAWWKLIQQGRKNSHKRKEEKEEIRPKTRKAEPFPLTDVQYAYWVGRKEEQVLGNVGCHAYLEFDGTGVEPERLEQAWNQLQSHHPMLRARFLENGTQEIMDRPYSTKIIIHDFTEKEEKEAEGALVQVRDRLSHRKLLVEEGQVAGVELSLLAEGKTRVHLDLDLLIADVQSLQILLRDLAAAYEGKVLPQESQDWDFGRYLENQQEAQQAEREQAKAYWKSRLEDFPSGPQLPMAKRPEEVKKTKFTRRQFRLNIEEWGALQKKAKEKRTTPALVLLTAYATVLERWSKNKRFLINIPYFNRNTELQGLEEVIADFTTLLLLEIDAEGNPDFMKLHNRIQKQLHKDMNHTTYSGVQLQRDLAKVHGGHQTLAPVVFACNLGTPLVNASFRQNIGEFTYMISQTPQVWNDFQTYEDEQGILFTWDTVDELFPEGMIEDMLRSLEQLLRNLIVKDWNQTFDVLPEVQQAAIQEDCNVEKPKEVSCLHTAFFKMAEYRQDAIALIDTGIGRSITYGELAQDARRVAAYLVKQKIQNKTIAITVPRGYQQMEAALAILLSGNIYVPVSLEQPKQRRALIHEKTGVRFVITNRENQDVVQWPESTSVMLIEEMEQEQPLGQYPEPVPADSAYIIMTSGSTGVPKGVEITHGAAWNTIQDINHKYHVTEQDTAFAISSMDFDLSVYDVFGLLGRGGTLVLIPEEQKRDASYWLEQVKRYQVTIWNSVPILLDMLLIQAEMEKEELPLRVVMLSGDWIGMDLPARLMARTKDCQLVAMGGATEASIWSNFQNVILPLPECWKSIPYGRPLASQAYRVVDESGRDCPTWVEGELWIGGFGVAKGYRGDKKLTEEKFITDSLGRWYRTGDNGRFWKDRTIEFLGRKDNQVKIRGHRIELGEIEHAISGFSNIKNAVVEPVGEKLGDKFLVAYVEAELDENSMVVQKAEAEETILDAVSIPIPEKKKCAGEEKKYRIFMKQANGLCIKWMLHTLGQLGFFQTKKEEISFTQLLEKGNIAENQRESVKRWISVLVKEGMLEYKGETVTRTEKMYIQEEAFLAGSIDDYMKVLTPYMIPMLTGTLSPLECFYEKEKELAPNRILQRIPGQQEHREMLLGILRGIREKTQKNPIHILELGTRDADLTSAMFAELKNSAATYTYVDSSKYFLEEVREKEIERGILNPDKDVAWQQFPLHHYDLVIASNSLHRNRDAARALKQVSDLLAPSGIVILSELVADTYLQDMTAALLEQGFSGVQDRRKDTKAGVLSHEIWNTYLKEQGLEVETEEEQCGRLLLCARQKKEVLLYTEKHLKEALKKKLPEFMIPKVFTFMEHLPITANGKADRKALHKEYQVEHVVEKASKASTKTEEGVLQLWKEVFYTDQIGVEDNYFTLGGDSLIATRLIAKVQERFRCKIGISEIFEFATVRELAGVIDVKMQSAGKEDVQKYLLTPDLEKQYEPFPLTDVQYAYWIGRSGIYDLGNVSTHCYFELDASGLDFMKAQRAWNALIKRHGMMRVIISRDGNQRILEHVPEFQIPVSDASAFPDSQTKEILRKTREEMSHQVIDTEHWPLFDVRFTAVTKDTQRIHISFDNLIFDGWSMFYLLKEWAMIYHDNSHFAKLSLSFRDYVLGLEAMKQSKAYEEDKAYWLGRINAFSRAPELPLCKKEKELTDQKFHRRSAQLSARQWNVLRDKAKEIGVTPSVLLISAYAEVLRKWSEQKAFTINLTQFDRKPLHPEVDQLVGDFTTLTLLEVKTDGTKTFAERTKAVQKQLSKDLGHALYSAVEFERELKTRAGSEKGAIMPIVFTSGLGVTKWNEGNWLGKLHYNISQTPQVWLDHQVVEMDGELYLFWDSLDDLFYPGMLDEMFVAYTSLLKRLAETPELMECNQPSLVETRLSKERIEANETGTSYPEETIVSLFLHAAEQYEQQEAVITTNRRLTYKEVKEEAYFLANALQESGLQKEETVAIYMEKGWEQVVAACGILLAGGAYLPVDIHNPEDRVEKILKDSKTKIIVVQKGFKKEQDWLKEFRCITVKGKKAKRLCKTTGVKPEELAYVIYTSGTTGMPKGVMINHKGAVNTIQDINTRYHVTKRDRTIGLSNLHFDLSVYDIFGMLSAGGAIVIPDEKKAKEPAHWTELLRKESITIWNSVPAFMEMLAEFEEHQNKLVSSSLRLVMMSGDWIPVSLPKRIRNLFGTIQIVSLGGATEASIWSNVFEVPEEIPMDWKSIPYGKPLANQYYYVLDEALEHCPDWVPGTLYIGGNGVAMGYLHDEGRTKEKFIHHPKTGENLYCTGDMGRYWKDGNIEFLGRLDFQAKMQGYRVELGEIEHAVQEYPGISENRAIVLKQTGTTYLVGFYKGKESILESQLKEYLSTKVPEYMIPVAFIRIEEFPKTGNGKIDRKELEELAKRSMSQQEQTGLAKRLPETKEEKEMAKIWKAVLSCEEPGATDNFFSHGGNSLKAIQLVNQINDTYQLQLSIQQVFEHATIEKLAALVLETVLENNVAEDTEDGEI